LTRGRCYDHNFLRVLAIFGKMLAFFSKTNVVIKFVNNLALFLSQKRQFFRRWFFRRKYSKNHNTGPRESEILLVWRRKKIFHKLWARKGVLQGSVLQQFWKQVGRPDSSRIGRARILFFLPKHRVARFYLIQYTKKLPNGHKISPMAVP
jgi:hypothetical protein